MRPETATPNIDVVTAEAGAVDASSQLLLGTALDADAIAPRALVPTARQQAHGESRKPYEPPPRVSRARLGGIQKGWPWTDWRATARERMAGLAERVDVRRISGPRKPMFIFLAIALFGRVDDLVLTVIGPELLVEFAGGIVLLGLVLGTTDIVQLLFAPFYGWVVDRVQRVTLLRISHIGGNLASAMSAFAAAPLGFAGLRGSARLLGVGSETPQATILADYYERESLGRLMPIVEATQNFSIVVGPVVAGILVSATNWRVGLFVLGGIATIVGLSTFLLREPGRGGAERRELGLTTSDPQVERPLPFRESWRVAGSIRTLRRIWYAYPFQIAGSSAFFVFVPLYFSESFGLSPAQRGLVTSLSAGVGALILLGLGPVAGRFLAQNPARIMTLIGGLFVVQAIGFLILGMSSVLLLSVVAALPVSFAALVVPPLQRMITLKVVPPRIRGLGFSTVQPWGVLGIAMVYLAYAAGVRPMMFTLVALHLIGAFLFSSGVGAVDSDMRAARASVVAERAAREAKEQGRAKLLVCRGVEAAYGGTQVLFGVDLDVEDGEILALLGTNGAGKSTLLRAIAGIHHASNGAILLDGRDITHEPAHANAERGVVMMPGGKATFPTLSVEQNLRAAAWLYREDEAYVRERTKQVLDFFPVLRLRLDEVAGNLSGGEQQMVGLSQAFLMRPRLLMIDELSLGLAPSVVEELLSILRAIHEQETTIVIVEQSVNVALTLAKRAVFMEKGEIRFDGETEALLSRSDLVRSVFIGGAVSTGARPRSRLRPAEAGGALEVEDVSVSFGGIRALRAASLRIEPGEVVGVIGPNGAGKTTLFDVISGFTAPDEGRVLLDGRDLGSLSPDARARRGIGRSFQTVTLFPALTVRENIAVALEKRTVKSEMMSALWLPNVREAEAKVFTRADGLIEILGLEAFADKFASELSTGSRRAVEVACMMAMEATILLLDEPSSGLAQAETQELGPVLTRLVRDTGCGLLMIEHDMSLVSSISDRLVAMELGSVISAGPPDDVLADPRVMASYLASEPTLDDDGGALEAIGTALKQTKDMSQTSRPGDDEWREST